MKILLKGPDGDRIERIQSSRKNNNGQNVGGYSRYSDENMRRKCTKEMIRKRPLVRTKMDFR